MAYQNLCTPRFYVSILQWLKSLGSAQPGGVYGFSLSEPPLNLLDIYPSSIITLSPNEDTTGDSDYVRFDVIPLAQIMPSSNNFYMVLGHNFAAATVSEFRAEDRLSGNPVCLYEVINRPNTNVINGFSIMIGNDGDDLIDNTIHFNFSGSGLSADSRYANDIKIGSLLYGTYFDMPHSPDLKLTMTREMDGIKRVRTKGGSDLVGHNYTKPAMWGLLGAWELSSATVPSPKQLLSRSGRRTWDLSFSFLADLSIFPEISNLNYYESLSPDGLQYGSDLNPSGNTLLDDPTSFYSQVIHKTNGGSLPFVFQPDSSNNNPDQFAICKMKISKFKQVANGAYNIKLKIREVW